MKTVRQLLKEKGREVWSVSPYETAYRALEVMAEKNVGALLVIRDGRLVGIFSERDYARKVILKGKSSKETSVGELMSKKVYFVSPDDTMEDCMALITEKRVRHLPVFEQDEMVGILSIGDVVNEVISEHQFTIRELENYITGSY